MKIYIPLGLSKDSFRDSYLAEYFFDGVEGKKIPAGLSRVLSRKLDMLDSAMSIKDLRSPPGNCLKELKGKLKGYYSIRVNEQFRLIFKMDNGVFSDLYLDAHTHD